jgi:O-antigen/teichoic acid export membrane protein
MGYIKSKLSALKKEENFYLIMKIFTGAFPIQILGLIFSYIISIFISRTFGAMGIGIFSLTNQIVTIFVLISLLGSGLYIVKLVAESKSTNKLIDLNNKLVSLLIYIVLIGMFFTFILHLYSEDISKVLNNIQLSKPLKVAALGIIPISIIRYFSFAFNGKLQVVLSTFFKVFLVPSIILIMLGFSFVFEIQLELLTIFYFFILSNVVVGTLVIFVWFYQNPIKKLSLNLSNNLNKTFPFFIVSLSLFLYSSFNLFIIDYFIDTKNVGLFSIAFKLGSIISLIHLVISKIFSPIIIKLIAEDNKYQLEKLLQKFSKNLFYLSTLILIFFAVFGKSFLAIWGEEFIQSYNCLIIIVLAQLFNIITGYTGLLLINLGYEKLTSKIILLMLPFSLILSLLLIPKFGIIGASISFAICLTLENIIKYIFVKRKLNISTIKFL